MSRKIDPQKKYWWLLLIVVPVILALIGTLPNLITALKPEKPSALPQGISITNNNFGNNMYFVTQVIGMRDPAKEQSIQQALQNATSLVQNNDYANAIAQLEQVATQYQSPSIYNNLGVLYANSGEYDKARDAYNSALKLDPNDQAANFNLGLLEQFQGNTSAAQTNFSKAPDLYNASATVQVPTNSATTVTTQIPGVTAQLVEFSKFQDTITLKIRLINSNTEDKDLSDTFFGSYLLDEATGQIYHIGYQSLGRFIVPANSTLELWGKFPIKAEDHPQYLTAVLEYGILFEHLTMQ